LVLKNTDITVREAQPVAHNSKRGTARGIHLIGEQRWTIKSSTGIKKTLSSKAGVTHLCSLSQAPSGQIMKQNVWNWITKLPLRLDQVQVGHVYIWETSEQDKKKKKNLTGFFSPQKLWRLLSQQ